MGPERATARASGVRRNSVRSQNFHPFPDVIRMDGSSSPGGDRTFMYCYPCFRSSDRLSTPRKAEGEFAFRHGAITPGFLMRLEEGLWLLKLYDPFLKPRVSFDNLVSSTSSANDFRCVSGQQRQCMGGKA